MSKQETFTQLYNQYSPAIYKLCLGYTGRNLMADDLLQETFMAVWNNMEKFRGEAQWGTWIYRIAINTCLTSVRKKELIRDKSTELLVNMPDEHNETDDQVQTLYRCISELKESDRLIIMLFLEEKPYAEIAEIVGISEVNLRVKLHRIKKELTILYQRYGQL